MLCFFGLLRFCFLRVLGVGLPVTRDKWLVQLTQACNTKTKKQKHTEKKEPQLHKEKKTNKAVPAFSLAPWDFVCLLKSGWSLNPGQQLTWKIVARGLGFRALRV